MQSIIRFSENIEISTTEASLDLASAVSGNYEQNGRSKVAASLGCFEVCNPNNSSSNPANDYSNSVLKTIQDQANKSQEKSGHIRVIIENREGDEYPKT